MAQPRSRQLPQVPVPVAALLLEGQVLPTHGLSGLFEGFEGCEGLALLKLWTGLGLRRFEECTRAELSLQPLSFKICVLKGVVMT